MAKNHPNKCQGSAKEDVLFVIEEFENLFCWKRYVSSSQREYEYLLITISCLFLVIYSVSGEWGIFTNKHDTCMLILFNFLTFQNWFLLY